MTRKSKRPDYEATLNQTITLGEALPAPLLRHVGGDELLGEVIYAMRDVTTWWP